MSPLFALVPLLAGTVPALARTITVKNSCSSTVWPGMHTGSGTAPSQPAGWAMAAGATTSFDVADDWTAGRIWARTGCEISNGVFTCLTGDCGTTTSSMVCTGTDVVPATLAEFTLTTSGTDNYDISLVDGFNIPINIEPSDSSCQQAQCQVNINALCPAMLRNAIDATGTNYGCSHPCNVGFGEETYGNRACCSGGYSQSPELCQACGVDYYDVFKSNCNMSYAYAYDEKSGTALWTCPSSSSSMPDYTVEFCPNGAGYEGSTNDNVPTQYDSSTATCSSLVTSWTTTYSVSASPSVPITSGTLDIVATNAAGAGDQAAVAVTSSGSAAAATSATTASTSSAGDAASGDLGIAIASSAQTSAAVAATSSSMAAASVQTSIAVAPTTTATPSTTATTVSTTAVTTSATTAQWGHGGGEILALAATSSQAVSSSSCRKGGSVLEAVPPGKRAAHEKRKAAGKHGKRGHNKRVKKHH